MDKTGYVVSVQLQSDSHYVTYHAVQEADGAAVMLKLLRNPYPSVQALSRFKKEFEILNKAPHRNIIGVQLMEP
jgi:hypothetical protein